VSGAPVETPAVEVITFGCRLNTYESEVIRRNAEAAGLNAAVIINTCAVTAEAERQARQAIRKARRRRPEARLIVTGCAAQVHPDAFAAMPEVDVVIGNSEKMSATAFGLALGERVKVNDIMAVRDTASHLVEGFDGRARAFLQVQNGCNHRCTFCIIPYGRGNSRSVPVGEVVAQAQKLVANGYREVVLTGVDIGDYGGDLPDAPSLTRLVAQLLDRVPDLTRLRLSSLDPNEVSDEMLRLYASDRRLMPHFHLSVQAGDDLTLKRMKRRHTADDVRCFADRVRSLRPDTFLGADLIAGFPTETEEMAANTERLVEDARIAFLHVFPYSARSGTPAARMPQLPVPVRKERAARLRALGEAMLARELTQLHGATIAVLVENGRRGRSEHYAAVQLDTDLPAGAIIAARVTGSDGRQLLGSPLHD